ncbi:hypothetical protein HPULCUR_004842 [Helicostylum pulchrum]|uniref:Uncharacterized protein n=1 Tax=Helicostylum pulchrum TaxID=562976 RepID=A0ABP9XXE6_9FUNG
MCWRLCWSRTSIFNFDDKIKSKDELESCKVRFEYMRMKGRHQGGSTIDRKDMVLE